MSDVRYICSLCGTARSHTDVATVRDGARTRWFCHPADATDTTCYMKFTMKGLTR